MAEKTRVVGVTFEGRQGTIADINEMLDRLIAVREPENKYDSNAIAIHVKKFDGSTKSLGYINRGLAAQLSPMLDAGKELLVTDYYVTGNKNKGNNLGVLFEYELLEPLRIAK